MEKALQQSEVVLLEPTMRLEIVAPEDCFTTIIQDLKKRRGETDGRGRRSPGGIVITAIVPAANLLGYATALRSIGEGRARYTVQFERYAQVPGSEGPTFRPAVGMRA
jgi:translation elongation factor EF-G